MPFTSQLSFAGGELSPRLWSRKDLEQNRAGAKRLLNMQVWRQGGAFRRPGTVYLDTLPGDGRLIPFVYSSQVAYVLAFTDDFVTIYRDGVQVDSFTTGYSPPELANLYYTQSFDVLFIAQETTPVSEVKRFADDNWTYSSIQYRRNDNFIEQPYWKFAGTNVELTSSNTAVGPTTLNASEAGVFEAGIVGSRIRMENGEIEVTGFTDSNTLTGQIHEALDDGGPTKDWEEQAFSQYRGFPSVVEIHEQRLALSGHPLIPNTVWLSETGDLYSFSPKDRDSGDVLATNAITVTLDANPGRVVWMESVGIRLVVGTTDGESGIEPASTSEGLGPNNVAALNYTDWGSQSCNAAVRVGKDIIHIQRGGFSLRKLIYQIESDTLDSQIITDVSEHLISDARCLQFQSTPEQAIWLLRDGGQISRMTYEPDQKVAAWTDISIDTVSSIAVLATPDGTDEVYFLTNRAGGYFLERLGEQTDDPLLTPYLDSCLYGHDDAGKTTWSGLAHLEGETVGVWADGFNHPDVVVTSGEVTLRDAYKDVWVGLRYPHRISFLSPNPENLSMKAQLQRILLYLLNSKVRSLKCESEAYQWETALLEEQGSGLVEVPWRGRTLRDMGEIILYSDEPYPFGLTGATFLWTVNEE